MFYTFTVKVAQEVMIGVSPQGLLSTIKINSMQVRDLNAEVQNSSAHQPSVSLLEQSLKARVEAFAFDVQEMFEMSENNDLHTLIDQIDARIQELVFLRNDVRWVTWFKENSPFVVQ